MINERSLTTCGPSWFVAYAYYNLLDRDEKRWENAGSIDTRINAYKRVCSEASIKEVIADVMQRNLRKNEFGVNVEEIHEMARKIIDYFDDKDVKEYPKGYLDFCGKSWFIVYAYYDQIDSSETRWKNVPKALNKRLICYDKLKDYTKEVAKDIMEMRFKKNQFGVPVEEVQKMARELSR